MFVTHTLDSTYRIGYTTKYGYGFNQQKTEIYIPYGGTYSPYSGPRKSPQRPYSGNWLEDLADWIRIQTDEDWPSYVDDDYWEEFLDQYPEYKDDVEQWFEDHGKTPPWLLPIGSENVLFLFELFYLTKYSKIKWKKKKLKSKRFNKK